jgi:hypothetical protein
VFVFRKLLFINKRYRIYVCYTNITLYIASAVSRDSGRSWNVLLVDTGAHLYILILRRTSIISNVGWTLFCFMTVRCMMLKLIIFCPWLDSSSGPRPPPFISVYDHTLPRYTRYDSSGRVIGPSQGSSTWQDTTLTTDRHPCPPAEFPASERPQTHALNRAAAGIGSQFRLKTTWWRNLAEAAEDALQPLQIAIECESSGWSNGVRFPVDISQAWPRAGQPRNSMHLWQWHQISDISETSTPAVVPIHCPIQCLQAPPSPAINRTQLEAC